MSRTLVAEPDTFLVQYRVMERQMARDVFYDVKHRHPELLFINQDPVIKHIGKGWWVDAPIACYQASVDDVKQKFEESTRGFDITLKVTRIEVPSENEA